MPELAVDTASIVIRGQFDPSKISIQELSDQGLLPPRYLSSATQRLSNDDMSFLENESFRLLANRDVIQLTAREADEFAPLRDMAVNILRLLKGQSLTVLGINRDVHFSAGSLNAWHAIGDAFAPKEIWNDTLELVGMATLVVQALRPDLRKGYRQITLQPSSIAPQGVYVAHNDHYTLEPIDEIPVSREQLAVIARETAEPTREKLPVAISILNNDWEKSMSRALAVFERVAQEAK